MLYEAADVDADHPEPPPRKKMWTLATVVLRFSTVVHMFHLVSQAISPSTVILWPMWNPIASLTPIMIASPTPSLTPIHKQIIDKHSYSSS